MKKKFTVAQCTRGVYGLILTDKPEPKVYADGNTGLAWQGIVLKDITIDGVGGHEGRKIKVREGTSWSSRHPKEVFQLEMDDNLVAEMKYIRAQEALKKYLREQKKTSKLKLN
jgi:hypothetical protein